MAVPVERVRITKELKLLDSFRANWGSGPWENEPDEVWFTVDEFPDVQCVVGRHPELGALMGYVSVPRWHPLHGIHYDDPQVSAISVHGGLTFSGLTNLTLETGNGPEPPDDPLWWFGFDCAHYLDIVPGLPSMGGQLMRQFGQLEELVEGLVRGEQGRLMEDDPRSHKSYRDVAYVIEECRSLAAQLYEPEVSLEPKNELQG